MKYIVIFIVLVSACIFDTYAQSSRNLLNNYSGKGMIDPYVDSLYLSDDLLVTSDSIEGYVFLHLLADDPECFTINYVGIDSLTYYHDQIYPGVPYPLSYPDLVHRIYISIKSGHSNKLNQVIKLVKIKGKESKSMDKGFVLNSSSIE